MADQMINPYITELEKYIPTFNKNDLDAFISNLNKLWDGYNREIIKDPALTGELKNYLFLGDRVLSRKIYEFLVAPDLKSKSDELITYLIKSYNPGRKNFCDMRIHNFSSVATVPPLIDYDEAKNIAASRQVGVYWYLFRIKSQDNKFIVDTYKFDSTVPYLLRSVDDVDEYLKSAGDKLVDTKKFATKIEVDSYINDTSKNVQRSRLNFAKNVIYNDGKIKIITENFSAKYNKYTINMYGKTRSVVLKKGSSISSILNSK